MNYERAKKDRMQEILPFYLCEMIRMLISSKIKDHKQELYGNEVHISMLQFVFLKLFAAMPGSQHLMA